MSSHESGWEAAVGTVVLQDAAALRAGAGDVRFWAVAEPGSGAAGLELGSDGVCHTFPGTTAQPVRSEQ